MKMGCRYKRGRDGVKEDRISSLPDELIHHILSFVDAKSAVQTSALSTRWRHIWPSLSHLNFDGHCFHNKKNFLKFVTRCLSRRNNDSDISAINFHCSEFVSLALVRKIARYAISHNSPQLHVDCDCSLGLPLYIFSSLILNNLSLKICISIANFQQYSWNLPALSTLHLNQVQFDYIVNADNNSIDLFSMLVNLKKLTLTNCFTESLKVFNIISVGLKSLVISTRNESQTCKFLVSAPNLSSFTYKGYFPLLLSSDGLPCLEKANIQMRCSFELLQNKKKQIVVRETIDMYDQLCRAKIIWNFSSKVYQGVIMYFLSSSPTATALNNVLQDN